jgi:hypothetical protein
LEVGPDGITILGDPLALLPCWVGELPGGIVASSSIHDILSVFPELLRPPDPLGITYFLVGGYSTRTVHARIRASASGTVLSWRRHTGLARTRDRRLSPCALDPDLGTKETVARVVELLGDKLEAFLEGSALNLLPLTGGFDSRFMACVLKERGIPCQAVTLGRGHHTEVQVARRVAGILGIPHTTLEPRGLLDHMIPPWLEVQEGQTRYGTAYIMELLDRGFPEGTPILHGLLGGNLAYGGAFFYGSDIGDSPESIGRFLVDWTLRGLKAEFPEILGLSVGPEALLADVVPEIHPAESSLHSMFLWDLEFRQPRGVGAQLLYLGRSYRAGTPFYDAPQISAWMSLPRMAHEDRRLLRWVFQERFPEVAAIPHAEERPDLLPNSSASLRHLARLMGVRARDGVLRRVLPGHDARATRRHIWGLWHVPSPRLRSEQEEAIREKSQAVGEVLGLSLIHI